MLAVVLAFAASVRQVSAQAPGERSSVFVGSAALAPGERASIDLVVLLDANHALDEFAIALSFDPKLVTVTDLKLDASWIASETGAPASAAGQLFVSGLYPDGACRAGSSCHLATISVTGAGSGEALIELSSVILLHGGEQLPSPNLSPGRFQLGVGGRPAGGALPAGGSVAGIREPGAGTQSLPRTGSSGPDSSMAAGLVMFVLLAVALVGGSALVASVVRRSWKWSSSPAPGPAATPASLLRADPVPLAVVFSEYLARVEAFGRVVGKASDADEALVRDVATAFADRKATPPPT